MRIENEVRLDFKDVLIRPKRSTLSTRSNVDISREFHFRHTQTEYHGVPIIAANMDTTGTFEMAHALDPFLLSTALHKHYAVDEVVAFFKGLERKSAAFYSMGIAAADDEKFGRVMDAAGGGAASAIRYVCIDVANGYTEGFVRLVAKIRERYPHLVIMAGNVVTGEMTEELILSGGHRQGRHRPGSVCTTRKMTGVGYPQLSAIIECADAAHGSRATICADGGCATPGDVAKALAGRDAGRHVRRPRQCAGHGGARRPEIQRFYGMSSKAAMEKYAGGVAKYRAAEGKECSCRTAAEMQGGRLDKSIATFSEVIRRRPDFAEAWNKRATALFLSRELDKPIARRLRRADEAQPVPFRRARACYGP